MVQYLTRNLLQYNGYMLSSTMELATNFFHVEFPNFTNTLLQKLNQQRQEGQLCDIAIQVQGHLFRAHRAVLAATSPYFCDQVLLKNSNRILLPDVMNPKAFENVLLFCYTGKLVLPATDIVSYLTVASFLQMWHVVDKCTELLKVCPAVHCQKSNHLNDHQSPSSSNFNGSVEPSELGAVGHPEFHRSVNGDSKAENGEDSPKEDDMSPPQLMDHDNLPSNSSGEHDHLSAEMSSQDGEEGASDTIEYPYTRPIYSRPSIMPHKQWVYVKQEKFEEDYGDGTSCPTAEEQRISESENLTQAEPVIQSSSIDDSFNVVAAKTQEIFKDGHERSSYDEQVDYYGSSLDEFSSDRGEINVSAHHQDPLMAAEMQVNRLPGYGVEAELGTGVSEKTSHSGFTAVVYKLYPCQCGKNFTHKSQRDRHMSMHLGLRPYGCGVCGKKFKMKHHLVGHMKIHTGIKPYECHICSKKFMWRDSFHRHVTSCTKLYQVPDVR
ncbi:zinc finger and BTB domain-containing protein 43 isoform X3 [Chiloscyllium plagiosum]|nr:zinc finger and BTB domain-containing protein 43 isoform X3 [Chiloscyllium plagiosum]XP_043576163.1 zinc finger and BTB domain-containing protein 43 isoform X3 [Chiloscyllium plagiosum]